MDLSFVAWTTKKYALLPVSSLSVGTRQSVISVFVQIYSSSLKVVATEVTHISRTGQPVTRPVSDDW